MEHESRKRELILDAAGRVFGQFGLRKTTVGDIIREAGVARATVYKYFPGKEEIFRAVIERETDDIFRVVREAVGAETTTRGKLRACLLTQVALVREKLNLYRVTRQALSDVVPPPKEKEGHTAAMLGILGDILSAGVESGEVSVPDVDRAARAMVVLLRGLAHGEIFEGGTQDHEAVVDTLLEMLFMGMTPR